MRYDKTRSGRIWVGGCFTGMIGAMALVSCATTKDSVRGVPSIEGARFVGNESCRECHVDYVRDFPSSPHARVHLETAQLPGQTGCESCHGPGSRHVAAGGGWGKFIVNPGSDPAGCFSCHLDTEMQFHLPQRHPVVEGRMNCVSCHDPHGLDILNPIGGWEMARADESCAQCHREQTRLRVFPHEALREGCTFCHEPHGSINRKLLAQPGLNLCLRCHAQVQGPGVSQGRLVIGAIDHSVFIARGTCWSSGCHTAVHGSDINHHLLY